MPSVSSKKNSIKRLVGKRWIRIMAALGISAALILFVFTQFDFSETQSVLESFNIYWTLPALACYLLSQWIITVRFRFFFNSIQSSTPISTRELFPIIALQTFFINMLPFRLGELSFLVLLRKRYRVQDNLSNLVLIRASDALVLVLILAASSLVVFSTEEFQVFFDALSVERVGYGVGGILVAVGIGVLLQWRFSIFTRIIAWLDTFTWGAWWVSFFRDMKSSLLHFWRANPQGMVWILGFSICNYVVLAFGNWCVYQALGVDLNYWQVLFAATAMVIIGLLPIHGILGLGSSQLVFIAILIFYGVDPGICGPLALVNHIVFLSIMGFIGLLGWVIYFYNQKSIHNP